ncbi:FtsX-like permease family protein [Actinocorallia sp. API 0066]|uniref:ABC transporter permease n=1 Tax=Actinocorallia sp. API 0066 TaxID=2896846 RepID=UPI001E5E39F6|nr:FtsX-like permease family protein [Actinocorallia sp. API 0066]MCD0449643.1 FtsX-like permease family protein [Actinocorallia sp. API 0066]
MNAASARLALLGSRSSVRRLVAIGVGVALGVAAFLLVWGAGGGLQERENRSAWLYTVGTESEGEPGRPGKGEALWAWSTDYHRGAPVLLRTISVTQDTTVTLPGVGTPPRQGTYYASPAMRRLIDRTPDAELRDRYGTSVGTLPASVLPGPDALVVVAGTTPERAASAVSVSTVKGFDDKATPRGGSIRAVMLMGGIAIFFPVLLLVGIATRLGAAARAERFATLRLIGATPGALARLAAWEMGAVALAGGLAGALLAWALRPVAALLPLGDGRLYAADLAVPPGFAPLVVAVMAVGAAGAAAWRIRRADIGPLGAARQRRERVPTAPRALPLLAGLAVMAAGTLAPVPGDLVQPLLIGGFAVTIAGIVVVGPWLTLLAGRLLERRAGGAASVIAGGRIRATPAATFRAASGMVVAVFTVAVFAGSASSVDQVTTPDAGPGLSPVGSLFASVDPERVTPRALKGIEAERVVVAYARPDERGSVFVSVADARSLGFTGLPARGHVRFDLPAFVDASPDEPAKAVPTTAPQGLEPAALFALTDGSATAIERTRTSLSLSGVAATPGLSRADLADLGLRGVVGNLARLAYTGVFVAILIAGVSLAVSTASAMLDRRRVLGLMRLMGMPPAVLRRTIVYETAVPLGAVLLLSLGAGFTVAWMILEGLGNDRLTMGWPDPLFFLTLAAGLALTLAATYAATSLVRRNTGLTTTRFE